MDEKRLRGYAVDLMVDLINGFVANTRPSFLMLVAREQGKALTPSEAKRVLELMDEALLYVTWAGPNDELEYVLDEEAAA